MSAPRPIQPSRALRTEPHESEPARSFDDPSPLLDEEDDFHNRLSQNGRRVSSGSTGGSFWRTTDGPAFNSAAMANKNNAEQLKQSSAAARANNRSSGSAPTIQELPSQKSDSVVSVRTLQKINPLSVLASFWCVSNFLFFSFDSLLYRKLLRRKARTAL